MKKTMSHILTVSELTRSIKDLLEAEFPFVWVRGQVTNLSRPASGHVYFTLTDGDATLNVVWFKASRRRVARRGSEAIDTLTGEVLDPDAETNGRDALENGRDILCAGRLTVYEPRGVYQLVAEYVQEQGVGDLRQAFEALRKKLEAKGWFDPEHKLALPKSPNRVAVVTSLTGAAVRDFLRIASERGAGCEIRIHPSSVQGAQAPAELVAALDQACDDGFAQVVALIRGGGSLEDLAAFNSEEVASAIHRCRIPVVTGIGHEPDVTIADYVADKRAATPTHAAELLWPERAALVQAVDELSRALSLAFLGQIERKGRGLASLRRALAWLSPAKRLSRMAERLADQAGRLSAAGGRLVEAKTALLRTRAEALARAFGPADVAVAGGEVRGLAARLARAGRSVVEGKAAAFAETRAVLTGLDPEKPLERGYSLVRLARSGAILRSAAEAAPGDGLDIRVRDGRIEATVDRVRPEAEP
jgi:exodeoxyribonuclease VII large subunit